ncbi:MAG: tripartite tricarboxylate transporter substrate binding protein [Proteobacteria bacterium]|nr:tripartite tricarboxylate transporter substrate binding protein [Pseudomonadota bacterium]
MQKTITGFMLLLLTMLTVVPQALAQQDVYPSKPIRLIVAFPPGGSVDVVARLIAPKLSEALGQSVVVDNRSGASGNIGTEIAARSKPDGYTLLIQTIPFVSNAALFKNVSYDALNDFVPIGLISSSPSLVVVHPAVPVNTVQELLAMARAKPGALNYAAAGSGTNPHIAGELFNLMGKVEIVAIQFKGGGPAMIATLGNEPGINFPNVAEANPYVTTNRAKSLPNVPTVSEAALPGYEFTTWHGIVAPKGTPREIVALLSEKLRAVLRNPELVARFEQIGLDMIASTPEEFGVHLKSESEKWARVIKERNMRVE